MFAEGELCGGEGACVAADAVSQSHRRAAALARLDERRQRREAERSPEPAPLLLIEGRKYRSSLLLDGFNLTVNEVNNAGLETTALSVWDGALLLAAFLEGAGRDFVKGKCVIELGSGTGFCGLAAAVLGASSVLLTDLPVALDNLRSNADKVLDSLLSQHRPGGAPVRVAVEELDWETGPAWAASAAAAASVDVILMADVVWLEELIAPLVRTLAAILRRGRRGGAPSPRALMSYESRSVRAERLLMHELVDVHGLTVERISDAAIPADYRHRKLSVFLIS